MLPGSCLSCVGHVLDHAVLVLWSRADRSHPARAYSCLPVPASACLCLLMMNDAACAADILDADALDMG